MKENMVCCTLGLYAEVILILFLVTVSNIWCETNKNRLVDGKDKFSQNLTRYEYDTDYFSAKETESDSYTGIGISVNDSFAGIETKIQTMIYNEDILVNPFVAYVRVTLPSRWLNCAGSIVTKLHILTAAKCLYDFQSFTWADENSVEVTVGTTYPFRGDGLVYTPFIMYPSKKYPTTLRLDLAIIELQMELIFSSKVQPIKMEGPTTMSLVHEFININEKMLVLGWGSEKDPGIIQNTQSHSHSLKLESLRLLSHYARFLPIKICKAGIGHFDEKSELCGLRSPLEKVRICPGTRGGPVIWLKNNRQFGLVSWGTCISTVRQYYLFLRIDTSRGYIDHNFYKSGRYSKPCASSISLNQFQATILLTLITVIRYIQLYS